MTALATSVASARVGRGLLPIVSTSRVMITGLPCDVQWAAIVRLYHVVRDAQRCHQSRGVAVCISVPGLVKMRQSHHMRGSSAPPTATAEVG